MDDYKRLFFLNQLSIYLIFSVSDFEWVFDGLVFNESFQSKVKNWTSSMDLFKIDCVVMCSVVMYGVVRVQIHSKLYIKKRLKLVKGKN
jgi:hypothetical protein